MKQAEVYMHDQLAGILSESSGGYQFAYSPDYLAAKNAEPVSLTLPLSDRTYA